MTTRLLLAMALLAVSLALPGGAAAQDTTTTVETTTTTTIAPSAQIVTACTVTSDQPLGSGKYHVSGHLRGAASYATTGMTFAVPNTLKAAGKCLCNSFARKPLTVLFGVANGYTFQYLDSTQTVAVFSTGGTAMPDAADLSGLVVSFFAVCQ